MGYIFVNGYSPEVTPFQPRMPQNSTLLRLIY